MPAGIDKATFERLSRQYRRRWRAPLAVIDTSGRIVLGDARPSAGGGRSPAACRVRRRALEAALRWGEATVEMLEGGRLLWCVPLMHNERTLGGLMASASERSVFPRGGGVAAWDVRAACCDLRLLAERENLTNAALLALRRAEYDREKQRAEAIHEVKVSPHDDIREMYLRKEPELLAAIRRDDRPAARQILNTMLVAMLHRAGDSLGLIKTFFLELVVTMCRTAVEAGGDPEQLLGANFASLQQLSQVDSEEKVAPWLHDILDHVMDSIGHLSGRPAMVPVTEALAFMERHLGEPITRRQIAGAAHLSEFHFSRLFKREVGRTCRDMLNQMRADRAAEMLVRTDLPLAAIAADCGFRDQSYFTKVFRRYRGCTPGAFRLRRPHEGQSKG